MLLLRKIFFYLFVAIYLLVCPLLILYGLGYTFEPGLEQGIVKSGLIYLSTAPPGATIYLGNRRYTRKTPAVLPRLLPGDYEVKLILKNKKPWAYTLPVEAGKATVLERILLLPAVQKPEILLPEAFAGLIPISGGHVFLIQKTPRIQDLFAYDWKEKKIWPLLPEHSPFHGAVVLSHHNIKGSSALLLRINFQSTEKFLWVVPRKEKTQIKDLTGLFSGRPTRVEWDPQAKKYLFAFKDGGLDRLDIVSGTAEPKFLSNVQGFGLFEKKIYALKLDGSFERVDLEGNGEKQLLHDSILANSLFGEKENYEIKVFAEDLILFLGENGELLANRLPYRFVNEGVLGLEYYPKHKRVLIWKEDALGILDFSKERAEKEIFEAGPEVAWVFKKGEKIEQAFWVYEGSHILFRDGDKVFLLELETYGKPRLDYLVEVKHKSSIFYSEEEGKLYYLDPTTGQPSSIEILPRLEILLLPFPERKEEKKKFRIGEL